MSKEDYLNCPDIVDCNECLKAAPFMCGECYLEEVTRAQQRADR